MLTYLSDMGRDLEFIFNHKLLAVLKYQNDIDNSEIARSTGLCQPTISNLLSGKNPNTGIDTVKRIADFFKKDVSEFIIEIKEDTE